MPTLTMNFEPGTTGEVEFVCRYFRFETVGGAEISAPFSQIEPIVSNAVVVSLPSGVDPDVVPNPWAYIVKIRVDGQAEYVAFITMPMTSANFSDIVALEPPPTPEYFVLKSDFLAHVDAQSGTGATEAYVDNAVEAEAVARGIDVDSEQTRAELAEAGLAASLATEVARATAAEGTEVANRIADVDAEQSRATAAEGTLTTNLATEVTNRTADVDAEETRALAAEALLAPKASPAFTGNPTAPTPSPGDNDTSVATTAFTTAAVAAEATARNTAIGVETVARIADVDAEETRALAAEATKAPIASPVFTGNPQVPSPTAGDNDTSIATTQFVTNAISVAVAALLNGAPGALDTLKELADAINDDASFAATVTAALALKINAAVLTTDGDLLTRIAGVPARLTRAGLASDTAFTSVYETIANVALKANIASPTFTGDPKAPTPTAGDNDTSIATTAFVTGAISTASGLLIPASVLTANGDILTRAAGVPAPITRANLAADAAFTARYNRVYSDTVDPVDSVGQNGDFFIRQYTTGSKPRTLWGPKAAGTWTGVPRQHFLPETMVANGFVRAGVGPADSQLAWGLLTSGDMPAMPTCTISDAAVSVPTGTSTTIGLTATESVDTDGFHSNVTNRERITIPTNFGGYYMVLAKASWASNATGYRRLNIVINGATTNTLYVIPAVSGSAMNFAFNLLVRLADGDAIVVEAVQTSGAGLNATLGEFTAIRFAS